jgi:dTDP-4-dehydrorhamnose 3,5-epimerase
MAIEIVELGIAGALHLCAPFRADVRGGFAKPFAAAEVAEVLPDFSVAEVFWSRSGAGVVRGLHFQYPPTAVDKLVFVAAGRIRDVILDVRADSATFGEHVAVELDEAAGAVFVPRGCAHGFEVLEAPAITCYLQSGGFDPATDAGVRWDSAGITWTATDPQLSDRDRGLPGLAEIVSLSADDWLQR